MTSVLVYGFYGHENSGDELFKDAFKTIFPDLTFTFTDRITTAQISSADAVFFGGGSFLYAPPNIEAAAISILHKLPIFYIGVGIETSICQEHQDLIRRAVLIAPRTTHSNLSLLQSLSNKIFPIIDLVYALPPSEKKTLKQNSVLLLPNISAVPTYDAPHWKHISWDHFKFEFAQFIDQLIDFHYYPQFFAMQQNSKEHDNWAAQEIINQMRHRNSDLISSSLNINFTEYEYVITQRFHGIVLSEINDTPYMCIHHSDKLKIEEYNTGIFVSLFDCSKQSLFDQFQKIQQKNSPKTRIELNIFEALKNKVYEHLDTQCLNTLESKTT